MGFSKLHTLYFMIPCYNDISTIFRGFPPHASHPFDFSRCYEQDSWKKAQSECVPVPGVGHKCPASPSRGVLLSVASGIDSARTYSVQIYQNLMQLGHVMMYIPRIDQLSIHFNLNHYGGL